MAKLHKMLGEESVGGATREMWMGMAQFLRYTVSSETMIAVLILLLLIFFRKECVLKERRFKEDIVDLAKRIITTKRVKRW